MTPFPTTIWYRAPELLLGTTNYSTSLDLWSAACVLSELLLSHPLLPGDTNTEQLALTVKLLGSPTPDDITALENLGTPDLRRWLRDDAPKGRPENLGRRFQRVPGGNGETIAYMKGILRWNPRDRWTAEEALGKGKGGWAEEAKAWWDSRPKPCRKEGLMDLIGNERGFIGDREKRKDKVVIDDDERGTRNVDAAKEVQNQFVFDFDDQMPIRRPAKKARVI